MAAQLRCVLFITFISNKIIIFISTGSKSTLVGAVYAPDGSLTLEDGVTPIDPAAGGLAVVRNEAIATLSG